MTNNHRSTDSIDDVTYFHWALSDDVTRTRPGDHSNRRHRLRPCIYFVITSKTFLQRSSFDDHRAASAHCAIPLTPMIHVDFCCGLLRNLLQQQKSVRNCAKCSCNKTRKNMASNDADDDVLMLFQLLECYYQALLLMTVRKS